MDKKWLLNFSKKISFQWLLVINHLRGATNKTIIYFVEGCIDSNRLIDATIRTM